MSMMTLNSFLFVMALIFIVRPISVFFSTLGSSLPFVERLFLACIYPEDSGSIYCIDICVKIKRRNANGGKNSAYYFYNRCNSDILCNYRKATHVCFKFASETKGLILAGATKLSREFAVILGELGSVRIVDTI